MGWVGPDGSEREITFREFGERSRRVANALRGMGAKPGDRVFVMLPRIVEWWEIILGCMRGELVSVPGTTLLTPKDIAYRINFAKVAILITDAANMGKIDDVLNECDTLKQVIVVDHPVRVATIEEMG